MNNQPTFDVFLAYNSEDKPQVIAIAAELKRRGLKPWLDEEQVPPGRPFQDVIQQAISLVKSAAIFIGNVGLGKWQIMELRALIDQLVKIGIPVIPVLLPGVEGVPNYLLFLKELNWVNFYNTIDDTEAVDKLVWGITQEKAIREIKANHISAEKGVIRYRHLQDLLADGKWKEADKETCLVMLQAVDQNQKKKDWIKQGGIENFPCTDLLTIDKLWLEHSNGHFGFSIQKKIYLNVGGKLDCEYHKRAWRKFCDCVGWRVEKKWLHYSNITFKTSDPEGHLPAGNCLFGGEFAVGGWYEYLFYRLETCY